LVITSFLLHTVWGDLAMLMAQDVLLRPDCFTFISGAGKFVQWLLCDHLTYTRFVCCRGCVGLCRDVRGIDRVLVRLCMVPLFLSDYAVLLDWTSI